MASACTTKIGYMTHNKSVFVKQKKSGDGVGVEGGGLCHILNMRYPPEAHLQHKDRQISYTCLNCPIVLVLCTKHSSEWESNTRWRLILTFRLCSYATKSAEMTSQCHCLTLGWLRYAGLYAVHSDNNETSDFCLLPSDTCVQIMNNVSWHMVHRKWCFYR